MKLLKLFVKKDYFSKNSRISSVSKSTKISSKGIFGANILKSMVDIGVFPTIERLGTPANSANSANAHKKDSDNKQMGVSRPLLTPANSEEKVGETASPVISDNNITPSTERGAGEPHPLSTPDKRPNKHPQHFGKRNSRLAMPIICGGVECDNAYLPNAGGLVCGLNHEPILMMSNCPAGKWDRGFAVFAAISRPGSQVKKNLSG